MQRCRVRALVLVLGLLAVVHAPAAEWRLSAPAAGVVARNVATFADAVARATGGGVVFSPAAPAAGAAVLPDLLAGKVQVGVVPLAELEAADPLFAMDRVPYLCTNFVDAQKLWQVLGPEVARHLEGQGLVVLYAVTAPPVAPLSNRALDALAAWRGVRLLAPRAPLADLARILGAQAVSGMSVRDGLLGRRVDVAFQGVEAATTDSAWAYASHYLDAPAWFPKQLVVARRDAVDALDDAARAALVAAAKEAGAAGWAQAREAADAAVQKLRDHGVKTLAVPVGALIRLEALGRELLFLWSDAAGETGAELVEKYYAIR